MSACLLIRAYPFSADVAAVELDRFHLLISFHFFLIHFFLVILLN